MEAMNDAASKVAASAGLSSGMSQVVVWFALLLFCYVTLQIFLMLVRTGDGKGGARRRGDKLLLLGQCGSGKTTLFFQLRDQMEVKTVSSLKSFHDKLRICSGEELVAVVETIDFPGHTRMRAKAAELLKEARCIVYLIDSEDKQKMKDVAEHLYELFTHPVMCSLKIPMLIAYNKTDLPSARPDKMLLQELEREIEQMRTSRGATLEGQDQADSYLGVDGEKFKLLEHSPCAIDLCRISAKKPLLEPVYDFIRQHFPQ
mmetsp:Transcript_17401/g.40654  ORF Transcript_17401/g.40654 Transcript_17401/m.40654 type:complete len:259 (-) Transcript_17401:108-884(-)